MIGKGKAVGYDGKIKLLKDGFSEKLQRNLSAGELLNYRTETNSERRLAVFQGDNYVGLFSERYEGEWFEYCRGYQYNEELELYLTQRNIDYALDRNDKALFMQLVGGDNK